MDQFNYYYEISDLIVKYLQDDISSAEREKLNTWLSASSENRVLFKKLTDHSFIDTELQSLSSNEKETAWAKIASATECDPKVVKFSILKIWKYAAVIALIMSTGLLLYRSQRSNMPEHQTVAAKNDIGPGGNYATLTLADGRKISLDEAGEGELARQQNMLITKTTDGQIVYHLTSSDSDLPSQQIMNTISTPRGGQFQLVLPDGTKVWLNSMSSLKYPVNFKGKERRVELTGEGYFEVSKNKDMPFIAEASGIDVRVLGTRFNISAYTNEMNISTTLIEGSVTVSKGSNVKMLSPGLSAVYSNLEGIQIVDADTEAVLAWKNGYFIFRDEPIEDLMVKISRWYDVDVKYQGDMGGKVFGGKFSKNNSLSELLKSLELTGTIKFNIEGRRVTAMP